MRCVQGEGYVTMHDVICLTFELLPCSNLVMMEALDHHFLTVTLKELTTMGLAFIPHLVISRGIVIPMASSKDKMTSSTKSTTAARRPDAEGAAREL